MATISLPTTWKVQSVRPVYSRVKARTVSPFTLQSQVYIYPGKKWTFEINLAPMTKANADSAMVFLTQLADSNDNFQLTTTAFVPASLSQPMTLTLVGAEVGWSVDTAKLVTISFVAETSQ